MQKIPIEVSARHIHLSQKDLEALFGSGYELKKIKQLTQLCDFAAEETLTLQIGDKTISNVRVVGPARKETQVEISITDAITLGVNPVLRISGNLEDTPGAMLIGPQGQINLKKGVIVAIRHLHCATNEAEELGWKNKDIISILVKGQRETTFHNVVIRIADNYKLCLHLDTDEGNAAGINKVGEGYLVKNK